MRNYNKMLLLATARYLSIGGIVDRPNGTASSTFWNNVNAAAPALVVWHADHPLCKLLPKTIGQDALKKPTYVVRISDTMPLMAMRNGHRYPGLVSKAIGDNGGHSIYYTATVMDPSLGDGGSELLGGNLGKLHQYASIRVSQARGERDVVCADG